MLQQNAGNYKGCLILIIFVFLNGCKIDRKPASVLSEEEMVRVMAEIYVSEEKIVRLNQTRDSSEKIFDLAKPIIFKRLGVPDSIFKQSYAYYIDRPVVMERIYTTLIDSLSLREQKLNAIKPVL